MSHPTLPLRVLVLGGTAEASALAGRLAALPFIDLTVSLAGRTGRPAAYPGRLRIGGFGGADGLANYLIEQQIGLLVDATHPFAETIAVNAARAAALTGIDRFKLLRPPWPVEPGWQRFPDLEAALDALPPDATALATTGSVRTEAFARRPDCRVILRSIEPPGRLPDHVTSLIARPPFSEDDETALMTRLGVTHLITRNAGGAHRARLGAAQGRVIPVLMLDRPLPPPGPVVETVDEAVARMRAMVGS